MNIVGSVSDESEEKEIEFISKIFLVSIRIKKLAQKAKVTK